MAAAVARELTMAAMVAKEAKAAAKELTKPAAAARELTMAAMVAKEAKEAKAVGSRINQQFLRRRYVSKVRWVKGRRI